MLSALLSPLERPACLRRIPASVMPLRQRFMTTNCDDWRAGAAATPREARKMIGLPIECWCRCCICPMICYRLCASSASSSLRAFVERMLTQVMTPAACRLRQVSAWPLPILSVLCLRGARLFDDGRREHCLARRSYAGLMLYQVIILYFTAHF